MNIFNSSNKKTKGKILRVKQGYNPNSSSMGSIVFILPMAMLAVTIGFGAISGIIIRAFINAPEKTAKNDKTKSLKVKNEKDECE